MAAPKTYVRVKFTNSDGQPMSRVRYRINYVGGTYAEGCTATEYLIVSDMISGQFDYLEYSRSGCTYGDTWYKTNDQPYTTITLTNSDVIHEYTIVLDSDGEVASIQRLEELFDITLSDQSYQQPMYPSSIYENDSINQQPYSVKDVDFFYSNVAGLGSSGLTLRLSDYLKTKTLIDDFEESAFQHTINYMVLNFDESATTSQLISYWVSASSAQYVPLLNYGGSTYYQWPTYASIHGSSVDPLNSPTNYGCLYSEGFILYLGNSPQTNPNLYATYIDQQIISGNVATFNGIAANQITMIMPEIKAEISATCIGNYHTTTYVSGNTTLQIVDTSSNNNVVFSATYELNMGYRWITDQQLEPQTYSYAKDFPNTMLLSLSTINGIVSNHTYDMNVIADIKIVYVMHPNGCFGPTSIDNENECRWLSAGTTTRIHIPTQILMYGYN